MSSFIVSLDCMHRCVAAMLAAPPDGWGDPDALGARLYRMNARAVKDRYGSLEGFGEIPVYKFRRPLPNTTSFDLVKALHCLRYQCNEGEKVPKMRLYHDLERAAARLEYEIVTGMDEYRDAAWG